MRNQLVAVCVLLAFAVICAAKPADRLQNDKDSIAALFERIPADLRTKVQENPVRCDRVNDWLQDHVNGKSKIVEMRVTLKEVLPFRNKNGTYSVHFIMDEPKVKILDAVWHVDVGDIHNVSQLSRLKKTTSARNFSFEDVPMADAEKAADAKHAVIKGTVQNMKLSRLHGSSVASTGPALLSIVLQDVEVDGKRWKPFQYKKAALWAGRPSAQAAIPSEGN